MTKARTFKTAVALGSLTATVALLSGMPSANAQQAPGGGSFPNSFLIPGTNTSIAIGGYVKLDYAFDVQQFQNINGGTSVAGIAVSGSSSRGGPGAGNGNAPNRLHNTSQFTAGESRFNIQTRTPTSFGEMKTFIEGDFTDPNGLSHSASWQINSNSNGFRLRRAYGTLGPWLLGQTDSTFKEADAEGETLDFGGQAGLSGVNRQPQIRYTYVAGNGLSFKVAAENPTTEWETATSGANASNNGIARTSGLGAGGIQGHIPDFIGVARLDGAWGFVSVGGVIRELTMKNGIAPTRNALGGGGRISGSLNTWGKDNLSGEFVLGEGLGRYILDDNPADTAFNSNNGNMQTLFAWAANASYQHWWLNNLRSNLAFGFVHQQSPSATVVGICSTATCGHAVSNGVFANKDYYSFHLNLIWSPIPQINTGVELMYFHKDVWGGASGDFERIQFSTQFKF